MLGSPTPRQMSVLVDFAHVEFGSVFVYKVFVGIVGKMLESCSLEPERE